MYHLLRHAIAVRRDMPIQELLTIPNAGGQLIFHLFTRWIRTEIAISSLLVWLNTEGVDLLAPDASGANILDGLMKRGPKLQILSSLESLLMQVHPPVVVKYPQLLERHPAVFLHPDPYKNPQSIADLPFPLLSLPADALRTVLLFCDIRGSFC
jgi:hypothetical protein